MNNVPKYQVFVSSTYLDLKTERQKLVESILRSKHIPAGMELFASSDKKQWEVIKKWIDESDIFVLLLGGRYGSIESNSGKSYTELEYDYAQSIGKPFFSIILEDNYLYSKKDDKNVFEQENISKYQDFKSKVMSLQSSFCSNLDQITIEVFASISEIIVERKSDMIGWLPANGQDENNFDIDYVKAFEKALSSRGINGGTA